MNTKKTSGGYIALTTMLIVASVVLLVGTSVTYLSIDEGQMSLSYLNTERSVGVVDGCVSEALLKLNKTSAVPTSVVLPEGSCTISEISQAGNQWQFLVTGEVASHQQKLRVTAERDTIVRVTRWAQE